ncbi:MAG: hypothetical protein D6731_22615 [Planctomycetota bacterium]|nr:MAG: hypothetical protein D6731_22615 [Planctomycetota bacterium]
MKPPCCALCGDDAFEDLAGALVAFAERPADAAWRERMERSGGVGHPPNVEWFCPRHAPAARARTHLPIDVALTQLRELTS